VLVLFGVIALTSFRPAKFGDLDFHREAQALAGAIRGAGSLADFKIAKAPGPVFYYTIPYLLVRPGSSDNTYWTAAFLWTILWVSIALVLVRRAGEFLGGKLVGWLALAFILAPPFIVYYSFGILSEPPAFIGAVLFGYGWARWRQTHERPVFSPSWWLTWSGLALLLLCRPNTLLILGVALLCGLVASRSKSTENRQFGLFVATGVAVPVAFCLCAFLLIRTLGGGWQEGNLAQVVLQGRFQFRSEPWDWRFWQASERVESRDYAAYADVRDRLRRETGSQAALSKRTWEWIHADVLSHPLLSARMVGIRMLAQNVAWANSRKDYSLNAKRQSLRSLAFHLLLNSIYIAVLLLALVFVFKEPGSPLGTWPLWSPWLALFIFHSLTYVEPRYLLPGRPGIAVLAALMVDRWVGRSSKDGAAP
jgi:hypothetical protein